MEAFFSLMFPLSVIIINMTLNVHSGVFLLSAGKGQKEVDRVEPCWLMQIVCFLHRGGCCCAAAFPWAPAGSACHEAAEGSQTQRGSPSTKGQRALQRSFKAMPGSRYTSLFWSPRPSLRPWSVAGERHKSSRTPGYSVSTTHWNWVTWGMGQEAIAVLSSWTPLC